MAYDDGITLHGKHSYKDFGAWLKSKTICVPSTIKITETVPYMQGVYDFTELYGEQTYDERTLEYEFDLVAKNKWSDPKKELRIRSTEFINWIKSSSKSELIDDDFPGFYFLAEVEDSIEIDDSDIYVFTIKVKFTAYGLMIKKDYEGQTEWDSFCFETDVMQQTRFGIKGAKEIILYNNGIRSLTPKIISDAEFILKKDYIEYKIGCGITKDYRFILAKGENKITIVGTGNIEFLFKIEVL